MALANYAGLIWVLKRKHCGFYKKVGRLFAAYASGAQCDCGVCGQTRRCDFIAARQAITVFVSCYPREGRNDPLPFCPAPARCRLGHCLVLQRIHPRQPPDRLLVKFNGFLALLPCRVLCIKIGKAGAQDCLRVCHNQIARAASSQPSVQRVPSVMTGRAIRAG